MLFWPPNLVYSSLRISIINNVNPISFNSEHKNMLSNLYAVVTEQYLAIPEKYSELITSLRTAYTAELDLDKKQTSYDDLLDILRSSKRSMRDNLFTFELGFGGVITSLLDTKIYA